MVSNDMNSERIEAIELLKSSRKLSWEQLMTEESYEQYASLLKILRQVSAPSFKEYIKLIDQLKKDEEGSRAVSLVSSPQVDNTTEISTNPHSSWNMYRKQSLKEAQHWSQKSIMNLEQSTKAVLKRLSLDMQATKGPVKGLVVGNVQSGKTANMTGLMAMAADNGFNVFIVLSGMIESLREQNLERIRRDLSQDGADNHWHSFNSAEIEDLPAVQNLNLKSSSHERYLTVVLKNKSRLEKLKKWLNYDPNQKRKMKVLLIDDEADQASINTQNIEKDKATAINRIIKDIVNDPDFGAMNYVAYTATPFANVLNEATTESLYPKDFITILQSADEYIGADQIFGKNDPDYQDRLDIVRSISKEAVETIRKVQTGKSDDPLPVDFKKAINWFLLAVAAMRANGYSKPISMMIHTDFKVDSHKIVDEKVQGYLRDLRKNLEVTLATLKKQYQIETEKLQIQDFKKVLPDYTKPIDDYPAWQAVEEELRLLFGLPNDEYVGRIAERDDGKYSYGNGIHICVDNSRSTSDEDHQIRLRYPSKNDEKDKAPAFIVIGGNTLSRGLTIQGLVSTFFLRNTNQADTLMQMARWFGYRMGYELYPRIWLDSAANSRYQYLREMNDEMLDQWKIFAANGMTPLQSAPRVKTSPSYVNVKITSNNKMQSAKPAEFNFAGYSPQIILYDTRKETIEHNLRSTQQFLNGLGADYYRGNDDRMVWRGVDTERILAFLKDYRSVKEDHQVSSIPNIMEWISQNNTAKHKFADWNVIYAGKGKLQKATNESWQVDGWSLQPVNRAKMLSDNRLSDTISIGVLRSPSHLLYDINVEQLQKLTSEYNKKVLSADEIVEIRKKAGVLDAPQLIVYRIDKNSKKQQRSVGREDLNVAGDLIGLSIMFPAVQGSQNRNRVEYVSVNLVPGLPSEAGPNVEEEFSEETDED